MREVRKYYLGSWCELTGTYGRVVMHHGYDSRRFPFQGFTGRSYSIFDGQLRNPREELLMHLHYSSGNTERSWMIQEGNNRRLFELLLADWHSGRKLPFPPEVLKAIPEWLQQFSEWLKEFQAVREARLRYKLTLSRQKRVVKGCFPRASLKKRNLKRLWNQPALTVLQEIAS